MLPEVLTYLNCQPGGIFVDGTLGACGHARSICTHIIPGGVFMGLDQDASAVAHAKEVLQSFELDIRLFHNNFIDLPGILSELDLSADGLLLDLGISQHQLEASRRGFSFQKDEPLDMRMDIRTPQTAADLIRALSERELARIFYEYGEERWGRLVARKIVQARGRQPIQSSLALADIVTQAIPKKKAMARKIHPATQVFMALRIAVNRELEALETFMQSALNLLRPQGRLCVLTFHSLEDRIVKHRMRDLAKACSCPPNFPRCVCNRKPQVRILTPRVIRPQKEEIARNPMARSAKLRVMQRIT